MSRITYIDRLIVCLAALFCLDRLLKKAAVAAFFRRPPPAPPRVWPSVSIIQPITRGIHDLAHNLAARLQLDYPGTLQHVLICDQHDLASQAICQQLRASHPQAEIELVLVAPDQGMLAGKIEKLRAGLALAQGEVVCFLDDDVAPRPQALRQLLPYLDRPGAGAVFGMACYTNWSSFWSSAMSGFVNANALLSYVPLTFLAEPFTITGHCFALRREVFDAAGGFEGMAGRIDDDHELARRLRHRGLRCVQTPMIYDVDNELPTPAAYLAQMQRWFVFPRLLMAPYLSRREQAVTAIGSLGTLLPSLVALLALVSRSRRALGWLGVVTGVYVAVYRFGERRYLGRCAPIGRLPALVLAALVAPLQIIWGLLAGDEVQWRGQRLRIHPGGTIEVIE